MKRIKALITYKDLELGLTISKGEEYETSDERAEQIISVGYAELVKTKAPRKAKKEKGE